METERGANKEGKSVNKLCNSFQRQTMLVPIEDQNAPVLTHGNEKKDQASSGVKGLKRLKPNISVMTEERGLKSSSKTKLSPQDVALSEALAQHQGCMGIITIIFNYTFQKLPIEVMSQ